MALFERKVLNLMEHKLTKFQTKKGNNITSHIGISLAGIVIIAMFGFAMTTNIDPLIIFGSAIMAIMIIVIITAALATISTDQEKWFLENAERKIVEETTYSLNDFYPMRQYKDIDENKFKKMPKRDLQFDIEREADEILFETGKPEFSAVLRKIDIADEDIRSAISKTTETTTLTYNLPTTAETFLDWSEQDAPFYIESFLKSIDKF